jgi:hypothetical protein
VGDPGKHLRVSSTSGVTAAGLTALTLAGAFTRVKALPADYDMLKTFRRSSPASRRHRLWFLSELKQRMCLEKPPACSLMGSSRGLFAV